ncbi:MAG TPA: exopolysaccharide biosynthesis polyprenyl glycosylphosphotransferase, partial [Phycisphaerales bacterium]|nr:exopolysaccharide biosynthesis polyprenyl glycosylphosphotransferase [Phycisphaerales bacterium]
MLKQYNQLFVCMLILADAAMVAVASYGAWAFRLAALDEPPPSDWEGYVKGPLILFTIPIMLFVLYATHLYEPRRDRRVIAELGGVLKASLIGSAGVVVSMWVAGNDLIDTAGVVSTAPADAGGSGIGDFAGVLGPARFQIALLAVMMPVLVGSQRATIRMVLRRLRRSGRNLRHVAIVGTGRLGQIVARTLSRNSWTGLRVSYFISHHAQTRRERCLTRPVLGGLDDLESLLERHKVDAVYLALPGSRAGLLPGLLRRLDRFAVNVRVVPDILPRHMPLSMHVSQLEGMPILSYRENPAMGLGGVTKRAIDIVGALTGLILLSPLFVVIAVLVRLSGPGRILFKQSRVSVGGEEFKIYKFRTMRSDIRETEPGWTRRNDPRVTRIGRVLRKTSLDEIPQLFNVLRGEMSLVGPRPERPELIKRFREDWRGYMLRQHVKAGMTGWAQVHGLRGDTCL